MRTQTGPVARIGKVANEPGRIEIPLTEKGSVAFAFDCRVEVLEPTGADGLTFISLNGSDIVARVRPGKAAPAGRSMRFTLDLAKVNLFDPDTGLRIQSALPQDNREAESR